MTNDLNNLETQIAELQKKRQAILDEQRKAKLNEVKAVTQQFGFTAADLGLTTGTRKKAATTGKTKLVPKYMNPKDPSKTWHGGKGPRPKWVKEFLNAGGKIEDIQIKK